MIKIINKTNNMAIPSSTGKDLFIKKNEIVEVSIKDYLTLLSIYGKNIEKLEEIIPEKKVIMKITSPSKLSETKRNK